MTNSLVNLTNKIEDIETVEHAENLGAKDYRGGAAMSENPYDMDKHPDLFSGWNFGFKLEQDYWEGCS